MAIEFTAECKDGALFITGGGIALKLTRASIGAFRLTGGGGAFEDMGAAQILARDLGEDIPDGVCPVTVERGDGTVTVVYGQERAEITLSPFKLIVRGGGKDAVIDHIAFENGGAVIGGPLSEGEALYGCGERFNRANQRGKFIDVMAIDQWCRTEGNSYAPVPFVLSSRGYALLLNRYERSQMDLGAADNDRWRMTQNDAPLDLYIFSSSQPLEILNAYSKLTGYAPKPAPWLFGIQVTRHARLREFAAYDGIAAMIKAMDENDFPWDAVIAEAWPVHRPETYGDLKRIADVVHGMGKKILVYEGCARAPYSDDAAEDARLREALLIRDEYLIAEPGGNTKLQETATYNPADMPNPRKSQFLDITNPQALAWWRDFVWGRLVKDIGIDGCKIDFCEQVPDHIPLVFADGRSSSGAHHWYPTLYNALMYRYFNANRPEGGMCFSRGGGIGAQRYPFLWAGDQLREWSYLQAILTSVLSSGLSGIPFMSYDMSGYMPSRDPDNNPEDKVFIRGAQMGCFSSNMQTHGIVTRPYDFEPPIKDIYRVYAKVHQILRPYLLEQADVSCATGAPLLRHLFLYDPDDAEALNIEDEYMLGEALLVAPVFADADSRSVYLPKGEWTGLFDGKTYSGRQTLSGYPAPFCQIPVFIRRGHASKELGKCLAAAEGQLKLLK